MVAKKNQFIFVATATKKNKNKKKNTNNKYIHLGSWQELKFLQGYYFRLLNVTAEYVHVCILVIFLYHGIVLKENSLFYCERCQISASGEFETDGVMDILEAFTNPVSLYISQKYQ